MPRWNVRGADAETGEDASISVWARTDEEAIERANDEGIFVSECTTIAADPMKVSARQAGSTAQFQAFIAKGYSVFTWITVNASDACDDCRQRQGMTGTVEFWQEHGLPGAADTCCGSECMCMLVPEEHVFRNPHRPPNVLKEASGQRKRPPRSRRPSKRAGDSDEAHVRKR